MCDLHYLRSAFAYAQSHQSLCQSLEYSMSNKLLTKHHFEFISLKGGCTGSSDSTLVKMPQCWKSHVAAHVCFNNITMTIWGNGFAGKIYLSLSVASYFLASITIFYSTISQRKCGLVVLIYLCSCCRCVCQCSFSSRCGLVIGL